LEVLDLIGEDLKFIGVLYDEVLFTLGVIT
jgi:hypothetical protein